MSAPRTAARVASRVAVLSAHRGFRPHRARITRHAARLLEEEAGPAGAVSIAFVGDEEMARVNGEFRGKPRPTDVLAFDLSPAGEVLVSVPRARAQAREYGVTLREEVARLVIHGLLHLCGYDHHRPAERRVMRAREAHWFAAAAGGRGWILAAEPGARTVRRTASRRGA